MNTSALARYLQDEVNELTEREVQEGAIQMAIKRMPITEQLTLDKSLSSFMRQLGDIIVRSDLVEFSYRVSPTLLSKQAELLQIIDEREKYFYSFCKGVHETTIIVSQALIEQVKQIFAGEDQLIKRSGLAAVSVMLPTVNLDTYGVYYSILKRIAWQGINLIEVVSTSHEITLIVSKSDVDQVFSLIMDMKR
ncbi:MAG: aspartate kinase [Bacteroidota bacterium]